MVSSGNVADADASSVNTHTVPTDFALLPIPSLIHTLEIIENKAARCEIIL